MVTNDKGAVELKHSVIKGLAKLLWEDNLNEETKEQLAMEISPGPRPTWRCCVYKEREILKWRIRLSCAEPEPDPGHRSGLSGVPACSLFRHR